MIHMSHLPRLLKDNGATFLGVITGYKGRQILANNPFVDKIHYFEFGEITAEPHFYYSRLRAISQDYDKVVNLTHSLEVGALALEGQNIYYMHQKMRDAVGKENYYDISTRIAGYPELYGKYRGEMFFTDEEVKTVEHDLLRDGRFKDKFRVMINLSGSSAHKHFIHAEAITHWLLEKYPDTIIFITGDNSTKQFEFVSDSLRVRSIVGKKKFRQAALMLKYMHCAIGAESGIMVASSMWDIPTIQLMTAASVHNHCGHSKNDYSLQSLARCSPCFKGPYKYYGCPKKDGFPLCVYFNIDDIKANLEKIYALPRVS
jgi:ADP-heptose:LPS heptosyltransferase